ncbi:UNVERIFIED_CONTAM: hypothetical protein GTU68_033873 [Idotea baltica]|nr:hypothetical protein [Idotea baltica]
MLFSSPFFLFLFLPLVLLIYFLSPKKLKNFVLLVFSLGFYTWGEKELVILILLSACIDFFSGIIISTGKRKLGLTISILFNLGILFYFKYSNFIFTNLTQLLENYDISSASAQYFSNIILPLGISFYTFQTMSYTIDVYRGNVKANRNFIDFATYVTLFPQLIAGPIVRYSEVEIELKNREVTINKFAEGVERFIIGLTKKVIIANNCAFLVDGIFNLPVENISPLIGWVGVFAFGFQVYFDFSGYSDMAIGLGKMFGFNFPQNFNYPYIAKSIQEFWRRWHITLSRWFKDYLYISLGGNRKGVIRTYLNLFAVFFLMGLWHGASWNYILWGCYHGFFIVIEKLGFNKVLESVNSKISLVYTLLIINFSYPIFRCETLPEAFTYMGNMFNFSAVTNYEYLSFYLNKEIIITLIFAIVLATPIHKKITNYTNRFKDLNKTSSYNLLVNLKIASLFVLLIVDYIYISKGAYNPFVYFKF